MLTRRMGLALLVALSLAAGGCVAAAGAGLGVAGYKYVSGELDTTYHQPYSQVYGATLTSLKGMNMMVTNVQQDAAGAKIEAKRADGTKVSVNLAKAGPDTTKAGIRVGLLGDENASRTIANNIANRLGTEQPVGRGQAGQQGQGGS
ncbi:MAG: DUF3568 family protein [Pseudomonadota bacterium]